MWRTESFLSGPFPEILSCAVSGCLLRASRVSLVWKVDIINNNTEMPLTHFCFFVFVCSVGKEPVTLFLSVLQGKNQLFFHILFGAERMATRYHEMFFPCFFPLPLSPQLLLIN